MPKAQAMKEEIDNLDIIKIENLCGSKDSWRKSKDNSWNMRKYLSIIYLLQVKNIVNKYTHTYITI